MKHRKKLNHLKRKSAHRKAMLANMANSLIMHKRIKTTVAKAKALRMYIEPLITKAKNDTTHSRRVVFRYLKNKYAVSELFREVANRIAQRPGGYTRILKTGSRLGDNAEMCFIELVDYNENMVSSTSEKTSKTKTRRSRRRRKKKSLEQTDISSYQESSQDEAVNNQVDEEQPDDEQQEEEQQVIDDREQEEQQEQTVNVEKEQTQENKDQQSQDQEKKE